jgi:hypothetical protein
MYSSHWLAEFQAWMGERYWPIFKEVVVSGYSAKQVHIRRNGLGKKSDRTARRSGMAMVRVVFDRALDFEAPKNVFN